MQFTVENVPRDKREVGKYFLTGFILLIVFVYNNTFVPTETKRLEKSNGGTDVVQSKESIPPTVYTKRPESIYKGVLQSKKGDVYRVSFDVRGGNTPQLEVFVRSSIFYETFKVGEVEVESADKAERKEVVFVTPGNFDSIGIRLKKDEGDETRWDSKFAFVSSLSVSRLSITSEGITSLSPTIIGIQGMPFARLEDMGADMLYTFSTRGDITDYQSVFETTDSAAFDGKKKAVVAAKRNGEYFIYKLDMVHPIKKLLIRSIQKGSDENEIRMQYSFDKSSWHTIEYTQNKAESQKFLLSLERNIPKESVVFVKVFYEGEDKKTGTFALEELEVNALVENEEKSF